MATGAEHDAPGIMPFFVYGTLLSDDGGHHRWLRWVNRIERNLIVCGYELFVSHGAFPYAMKDDDPNSYVFGELLWPANDKAAGEMTDAFDQIELHPSFYTRTAVTVTRTRTSTQEAWMYVMRPENIKWAGKLRCIGSSWLTWKRQNPAESSLDFAAVINSGI